MMRRSALKPTRLPRLARMPEDVLSPLIAQLAALNADRMRLWAGSRRRPYLDLRLALREGDLFVTNARTGLTVRATSPGPRARLVAEVADGLARYNDWWAKVLREEARQREKDAIVTVAAAILPPPDGATP